MFRVRLPVPAPIIQNEIKENAVELVPVKGYEEYYSATRDCKIFSHRTNMWIKFHIMRTGYYGFSTRFGGRKSKAVFFRVHRLIALTFVPNPLKLPQINHIDGNKLNNNVTNLEWCTPKQNSQHAVKMGLIKHSCGVHNPNSKLSIEDIKAIRENSQNLTIRELGLKYKVHHSTIQRCTKNKRYK